MGVAETSFLCSSHDDNDNLIYKANQWANYAVLILQGRALVETSNEKLLFEAGPFMLFGETVFKCTSFLLFLLTLLTRHSLSRPNGSVTTLASSIHQV